MCFAVGRVTQATVVHHTTPHKGDMEIFWDATKWQSLCDQHHNIDAQRAELGSPPRPEIGSDGWPIEAKEKIS